MKLEAVHIQNFRSIQDVILENCGGFNVIVGKNNAGKSNILLSINAFFKCLNKGEPIILEPPIGKSIDHHVSYKHKLTRKNYKHKVTILDNLWF
jgi:AAA15 family ATPase/GTPase